MWEYWLSFLKSEKLLYVELLTQHYLVWFGAGKNFHEKPFQFVAVVYFWTRQPTSFLGPERGERNNFFKEMNIDTPQLHSELFYCLAFI